MLDKLRAFLRRRLDQEVDVVVKTSPNYWRNVLAIIDRYKEKGIPRITIWKKKPPVKLN